MNSFARRAARNGTAEFGDGYLDVLQSFGGRLYIVFFSIISKLEILGIGFAMNQKAVLAVGADLPAACP